MRILLAMLLVLAPFASRADDGVHVSLLGGLGLAQGLFGGHVEVRKSHLAVFAGSGLIFAVTLGGDSFGGPGYGGVAGARWYNGDSGDRFFLSAQFAFSTQRGLGDPEEGFRAAWQHSNATTLTAGWRFRFGGFLLDLGAGAGVFFENLCCTSGYRSHLGPDGTLAFGYEF
jgi:hypothetical protein